MPTQAGFNPHDLLNQTIGGYQLREVLGTGNALVYRAYDKGRDEYVALKLVSWPGAQVDDTTLKRFKREIDLLRKRHHAAIIDIYDWRTTGDYVYMVMEYCDGTLARWLREHRPTLREVLEIADPLAEALDFLHDAPSPVLHRDIKPANILFKGRDWFISDFGIARSEADQLVTADGTALGTLRYAAPEQMAAAKLGPETDIYSFGLVVYEMLAGGWVLGARRHADWAYDVPPISRFHKGLNAAVDDLFRRWLAPKPADRPHRASEAVRELAGAAGVLRSPALARLYDLATALAERPNDPVAWAEAADLLAVIEMHEPAFFDPRGLAAELERRQAGQARGPNPTGYTGAHPPQFYSEQTVIAPVGAAQPPTEEVSALADEAPMPPAPKLLPATDIGEATFSPRSRYDATATLLIPANMRVTGSVFGRNVVVEPGGRVDGDVYSLGDLTLGRGAEVGGVAIAGGKLATGRESWVHGSAGVEAETVHLERAARVSGWIIAGSSMDAEAGVELAGLLAGDEVALAGSARIAAAGAGSVAGAIRLAEPVLLAGLPAGTDSVHPWPPAAEDGETAAPGQVLSNVLTRRGRELAESAQAKTADEPVLAVPRPVAPADPLTLQTAPATDGPTLYLPTALQAAPDAPPPGLPAEAAVWEGPLAAAWLLDRLWTDFLGRLRLPALIAAGGTVLYLGVAVWLALQGQPGTAGLAVLAWLVLVAVIAIAFWFLRPRPLEMVRVWWAWETWGLQDGVVVWDTLDPGAGAGYLDPDAPLAPLVERAAEAAEPGITDTALLARLSGLNEALESLPWKSWPGVFAPLPPAGDPAPAGPPHAAEELLRLPVEMPPPDVFPQMRVLTPRLDPEQVRAGADRLAAWSAAQTEGRAVEQTLTRHLGTLAPTLERWEAAAAAEEERIVKATAGLATLKARAEELAGEALAALEEEIGPDIDRLWQLHVEGSKLISGYFVRAVDAQRAASRRAQERAAAQVAAVERDLRRQEGVLAEIEADLRPLDDRWRDVAAAHERTGAGLRRAWKQARSPVGAAHVEEPFLSPRPVDLRQAATVVPQLEQDASRLVRQGEEFTATCAKEERDLPADLPWPLWPARITTALAPDEELAALEALLRRLRNEPTRARARLDTQRNLMNKTMLTLERAMGARETLAQAIAEAGASPAGEPGRWASLETQAAGIVRRLRPLLNELADWQRRLERTAVAYGEVVDELTDALKGARGGPTWEQGQRIQADYSRLQAEHVAATTAHEQIVVALAAAQAEARRAQIESDDLLVRLSQAEKDVIARSEAHAGQEEGDLRKHIAQLRTYHETVLAALAGRENWPAALGAFQAACADLKIGAVERLRERIQLLAALVEGRIADTGAARAAVFWPLDTWPAGDMLYLVPVWLLRYRPWGRPQAPRLLAVTPGSVRAAPRPGRFRPALGFALDLQPGFATRFAADVLNEAASGPGITAPLEGDNLLAPAAGLAARWQALAAHGLVPAWLPRLLR